ncbi:MAG TPA: formylglycine-generating enzyme family protein [Bryobacteraceae bacterium]|nr:formylglycine-generating enzyme family protein [Acidobacteriaceae bacterium]
MSCITPQPSKATDGEAPVSKKGCCAPSAEARAGVVEEQSGLRSGVDPRDRMIAMQGGTFLMGTDYAEAFPEDGEGPVREVTLDPFWIDQHPVTNELFSQFVEATGYRTEAERFGWSFVFWAHIPKERFYELVVDTVAAAPWWCKVPGANWRSPEGPGSAIKSRGNHPVVHVSWNDAVSFCEWSGQRLPTEAEWEYAARGGLVQKLYPWGDKLRPDGEHRCNIWQGEFPRHDTGDDGYTGTCPVDAFPPNGYGLYSATGNTWEWCADWFSTDFHLTGSRINPTGPESGENKVMKGGSFLCHKSYCNRYRVAARSSNTPDSSTSHMSFRCARNI